MAASVHFTRTIAAGLDSLLFFFAVVTCAELQKLRNPHKRGACSQSGNPHADRHRAVASHLNVERRPWRLGRDNRSHKREGSFHGCSLAGVAPSPLERLVVKLEPSQKPATAPRTPVTTLLAMAARSSLVKPSPPVSTAYTVP